MALSFVGITSAAGEADGSWTIALPGTAAAGDTAVIFYANDNVITPSISGTSDEIITAAPTTSVSIRGWSKVLTSGEISDGFVTITDSGGNGLSGASVMGVWSGAGTVANGTVDLNSSDTDTFAISNTGLTSGGHYFAVAFIDDDLTTVSSYPTDYASSRSSLQCGSAGSGGTLAWARSESLPTGTNEFVFGSSDTGVSFAFQIDEQTVFDDTVSESAAATGTFASTATLGTSLTETATATGTFVGGLLQTGSFTETATADASFTGGVDWGASLTETASATDSFSAQVFEPNGWEIPIPASDGWVESGSGGGAWTEVSDTDTDWTEI